MRCFIGFLVPEKIRESIKSLKEEISRLPVNCKFVEDENLHVCFSFLGEVEEGKIESIKKSLDSICNNFFKIEAFVDGLRAIPTEKYIRVLALEVSDSKNALKKLIKELQSKIGGDSKPPHITICRVKSIKDKVAVTRKIKELRESEVGSMTIKSVQLIKSELRREGPVYSVIHESVLRNELS